MSVYTECSKAARELLRSDQPFTDLDIIEAAQRPDWGEEEHKQALHDAAQIAAAFYRDERLVRFGPVEFGPESDYARGMEGHLIYAPARPTSRTLRTPNGEFDEIFYGENDKEIRKNGRRKGSTRNDLEPWSGQSPVSTIESLSDRGALKLQSQLRDAHSRIDNLEEELARLREHVASQVASAA